MLHSSRHHKGFKEWAVQIIHSARPKQLPDAHSARKSAPDPSPGRHCAASIKSFGLRICATTKAGQDKQLLANTLAWMCFFCDKIPFWYRRIYIKQFISLLDWCQNIRYSGCLKVDSPIQIYNTFSLKLRPRMLCHGFCEDHASTQILFSSTTIPSAACLAIPRCVLLLHCSPPIATHLSHAHLRPLYINARQYQPCPLITAAAHP